MTDYLITATFSFIVDDCEDQFAAKERADTVLNGLIESNEVDFDLEAQKVIDA